MSVLFQIAGLSRLPAGAKQKRSVPLQPPDHHRVRVPIWLDRGNPVVM